MADISKITLPSGQTYDIKDAVARSAIQAMTGGSAVVFIGVSSVELTDGGNETPVVGGTAKIPAAGQIFFYQSSEFIWGTDNAWHKLGDTDISGLGDLAYKDSVSASYTPAGTIAPEVGYTGFTGVNSSVTFTIDSSSGNPNYTPHGSVSKPTFTGDSLTLSSSYTPSGSVSVSADSVSTVTGAVTVQSSGVTTYTPTGTVSTPTISIGTAGSTTTIKNPTSQTVVKTIVSANAGTTVTNPLAYASVSNEILTLNAIGYTTGNSISTSDVTVKTGDASYTSSQPSFSGTGVRLAAAVPVPDNFSATFTGTESTIQMTGTPSGSVSKPTFSGSSVLIGGTVTPQGRVGSLIFTGTTDTITST